MIDRRTFAAALAVLSLPSVAQVLDAQATPSALADIRAAAVNHPAWVRSLRDQCEAAGVPFLFKQWGSWAEAPADFGRGWSPLDAGQHMFQDGPEDAHTLMLRGDKKANGRLLDGKTHDGFPELQTRSAT